MKKTLITLSVLLGSLWSAMILLHAIDLMLGSGHHETGVSPAALAAGKLHEMVATRAFWTSFPSIPALGALLHIPSLALAAFIWVHVVYIWGVKKQLSPLAFGLLAWSYGLVPYGLGFWALNHSGRVSEPGGFWAIMLLGMLCFTGTCAVSVLLGLVKIDVFKAMTRVPMPHVRFKTQPAAGS